MKKNITRLFSVLLAAVLVFGTLPVSAMGTDVADPPASTVDDTAVAASAAEPEVASADDAAQPEEQSAEEENVAVQSIETVNGYEMNIFFLDCGRKYYSVDSIKKFIDNASTAGFNYIQLAVGNDGMRFLLDDMSLTVGDTTYDSDKVKAAIHQGNTDYKNTEKAEGYTNNPDALTETEMNEIIAYAHDKGMGVIPCINTPGHMDAILTAATSLTGKTCSYSGSVRTIDVTNDTAVAFTQAFLKKYIAYFAGMGCKYFNMGADEYANDVFDGGGMGFGNLLSTKKYGFFVTYVNAVAALIESADMMPMAFNDGIYYKETTNYGTFDKNIVVCYWSNGWESGYLPAAASYLRNKGHKLVNTNGTYYWIVGEKQCSADTANGFSYNLFANRTKEELINGTLGSMFCIWSDFPGRETEATVVANSAVTIAAFGNMCPAVQKVYEQSKTEPDPDAITITPSVNANAIYVNETFSLAASKEVFWSVDKSDVIELSAAATQDADGSNALQAAEVTATAKAAGTATITATDPENAENRAQLRLTVTDAADEKTITVAVGDTETISIDEEVTVGTVGDSTIAEVASSFSAAGKTFDKVSEITSGKQYIIQSYSTEKILSPSATNTHSWNQSQNYNYLLKLDGNDVQSSTYLWTLTGSNGSFIAKNGNNYLQIGNDSGNVSSSLQNLTFTYQTGGYWTISNGNNYLNDFGKAGTNAGGWSGNGASSADTSKWYIYEVNETTTGTTQITVKGKKTGTTYVTIGDVQYKIVVTPAPLKIEYWITNETVTAAESGAITQQVQANDERVNTETGAQLSQLVPESGWRTSDTQKQGTVFWKGTRLTSDKKQTNAKGDDKTAKGDDFSYIRYWDEAWSFSRDGKEWQNFNPDDQVVAYYLQRTEVTNEVTTDVVDWGSQRDKYTDERFVLLDFAVKYPSGTRIPDKFPVENKTVAFHCDNESNEDIAAGIVVKDNDNNWYRNLGSVRAVESDNYEVYMITVTQNSDDNTSSGRVAGLATSATNYSYKGTEKVVWADSEDNIPSDYTRADDLTIGGEPFVAGLKIYYQHALLVTYYLREKIVEDALTVHYVDKSDGKEFNTLQISVKDGTIFKKDIARNDANPNGPLINGEVKNILGKTEVVTADLSEMKNIDAAYRYSNYTCVEVVRNDDKEVTLYYNFDTTASFVIDFGSPLKIRLSDINEKLANKPSSITSVTASASYGKAEVKKDDWSVIYTPDPSFASSESGDVLKIYYAGTNVVSGQENGVGYSVHIYPASNVLYEEDFLTDGGVENSGWTEEVANHDTPQETQKANEEGKNPFGYDSSYAGDETNSAVTGENGVWEASSLTASTITEELNTEFYGNAFDIIGNCDSDTGRILMIVKSKTEGGKQRAFVVDTRYKNGKITQVPLAHAVMGAEDSYTVTIYASGAAVKGSSATQAIATMALNDAMPDDDVFAQVLEENGMTMDDVEYVSTEDTLSASYSASPVATMALDDMATYADNTYPEGTHVEIDGFRVYRSTSDEVAKNYPTNEQKVTYKNILDVTTETITAYTENGVVEKIATEEYEAAGGPQNEIYLSEKQSIAVQISGVKTIQVSLRAVNNATQWNNTDISSNTEMYYELTANDDDVFTIMNTGSDLLAIGNVKIPEGATEIKSGSEIDQQVLIKSIQATYNAGAEEPEVFTPETFTAKTTSTKVIRNKVVTLKVSVSSDVAYVTVNGVKYTRNSFQSVFQKNRTILVVNTVPKNETKTYEIVAYNADGVASETKTVTG